MSTSLSATIIEFLERVFGEDKEEFLADPEGYLSEHGLDDLSCADFDDALVSFFENAEFSNDRDGVDLGADFHTESGDGESDHEAIARHLTEVVHEHGDTYVTNHNDDRDTYVDNSFQGTVLGDATFDNDTVVASGDGAVAAGDDVDDVVTGDDNVIGNGNNVGDGNFGAGSVSGGISVDDGGAFGNNGGNAAGSQDDNSDNSDNSTTDNSDNSLNDSFNPVDNSDNSDNSDHSVDIDSDNSVNDSFNASLDIDA